MAGRVLGPYVDETRALAVLVAYVVVFLGVSAWLLRRRGVTCRERVPRTYGRISLMSIPVMCPGPLAVTPVASGRSG